MTVSSCSRRRDGFPRYGSGRITGTALATNAPGAAP